MIKLELEDFIYEIKEERKREMNEEKKQCDSKICTKEDCAGCSHA